MPDKELDEAVSQKKGNKYRENEVAKIEIKLKK